MKNCIRGRSIRKVEKHRYRVPPTVPLVNVQGGEVKGVCQSGRLHHILLLRSVCF